MSKKLAFGLMRLPLLDAADPTGIDLETVRKMVDCFMDAGCTHFDTAAPYHRNASETAFRECVAKRYPREAYTLTDKLSMFAIKSKEEIPAFFDAQLERCGVEYFDYYWLHAMNRERCDEAESLGAFDFILQKKAEGKVRHVGFSFHDKAEALDYILTRHPEMECVQLQLNYIDWEDEKVQARQCYEVCMKHGKSVMVMEPVKGGRLAAVPEEAGKLMREAAPGLSDASWAIRFAASLENVTYVLSGMSTLEQMEDNLSYMKDFRPLTSAEQEVVKKAAEIIRSRAYIDCTACRYCVDGCPQKIAIPNYFSLVNEVSRYGAPALGEAKERYVHLCKENGKASDCVQCGQCEGVCPQHLPVIRYLEDAARMLE